MPGGSRSKGSGSTSEAHTQDVEDEEVPEEEEQLPPGFKFLYLSPTPDEEHPGSVWFTDKKVVKLLTESFTANYKEYMTHWNGISDIRQRAIWRYFNRRVRYEEAHARAVNEEFLRLIKIRISHLIYRANKAKEKPKWMPSLCFNKLQDRKNDEKWLDKSKKAKANRCSGGKDGKAGPTHTLGQKSALAVLEEMAKNEQVTPIKLLEKTKKNASGVWIHPRAEQIANDYNERAARREAGEIETDEYEMYLDIAQRDNKGRVFGMGSATPSLFRPPQTKSSGASGYAPGPVAQYATQQKELQNELDEVKKQQEWFKEQMKLQFGWTYPDPNCNQGVQPQRRDPFDDDGSGASMGNQVIPPVQ